MLAAQGLVIVAALATWYGFASRMRRAFRYADRWTFPKTVLVVSGWICTIVQLLALVWYRPIAWWRACGAVALYILAYTLFHAALRTHGRDRPAFVFTEVTPCSFCASGPYRYIRHPLYAAYLLAWLAPVLATAQWWLVATTAWMAALYTLAAWQEERAFAQSSFAAEYQRYRQQAGMFWPRLSVVLHDLSAKGRIVRRNQNQQRHGSPTVPPVGIQDNASAHRIETLNSDRSAA